MKKLTLITTAILLIIMLTAISICAADSDYIYTTQDGEATIIGYTGVEGVDLTLPHSIDGYTVGAIADGAFDSLIARSLVIPEGIKRIGDGAFAHSAISYISLPASVESIGEDVFKNCWKLESIDVAEGGSYYSEDGILYQGTAYGSALICYPTAKQQKLFNIPADVNRIKTGAIRSPETLRFIIEADGNATVTVEENAIIGTHILLFGYSESDLMVQAQDMGIECADISYIDAYDDVDLYSWYAFDVLKASARGFMNGTGNRTFSPNVALTREQFVQILFNMNDIDSSHYVGETGFDDVSEGEWYSAAVKWAKDYGITAGVAENRFGLAQALTREQLAVFLMNYSKLLGVPCEARVELSIYTDEQSISPWAREAVEWAVAEGLFHSTGNGNTLSPRAELTRAVAARVMVSYSDHILDIFAPVLISDDGPVSILPDPFRGTDIDEDVAISDQAFIYTK